MATLTLLHTNDTHGKLTPEKLPYLSSLRSSADLYLDSGDCIKAGNLAVSLKPDPVWKLLAAAGCDASVPGNRESHLFAMGVKTKFAGCTHTVLCANWRDRQGRLVFAGSTVLKAQGARVGVLGVMVPMVTDTMAARAASHYLWAEPIPVAVSFAARLRKKADVVIALTHIGLAQDRKLAEATNDIDLILGGHSHTVLDRPEVVNGTPICQGGSHARFIGRYTLEVGEGLKKAELLPWP